MMDFYGNRIEGWSAFPPSRNLDEIQPVVKGLGQNQNHYQNDSESALDSCLWEAEEEDGGTIRMSKRSLHL